jgi:hypothetical protein
MFHVEHSVEITQEEKNIFRRVPKWERVSHAVKMETDICVHFGKRIRQLHTETRLDAD